MLEYRNIVKQVIPIRCISFTYIHSFLTDWWNR